MPQIQNKYPRSGSKIFLAEGATHFIDACHAGFDAFLSNPGISRLLAGVLGFRYAKKQATGMTCREM
ncbi:MAG: hypothetical protein H6696_04640 [Deferribacteres bacterium]|nr:hypothetical protein [Deferribacteres bacterium]